MSAAVEFHFRGDFETDRVASEMSAAEVKAAFDRGEGYYLVALPRVGEYVDGFVVGRDAGHWMGVSIVPIGKGPS